MSTHNGCFPPEIIFQQVMGFCTFKNRRTIKQFFRKINGGTIIKYLVPCRHKPCRCILQIKEKGEEKTCCIKIIHVVDENASNELTRRYQLLKRKEFCYDVKAVTISSKYFVIVKMKFSAQGSLKQNLKGIAGEEEALEYFHFAIAQLSDLHRAGITHNQIQSSNLLLGPVTNKLFLTGFSQASERKSDYEFKNACRKDIFALGKVLLEMLLKTGLEYSSIKAKGADWILERFLPKSLISELTLKTKWSLATLSLSPGTLDLLKSMLLDTTFNAKQI